MSCIFKVAADDSISHLRLLVEGGISAALGMCLTLLAEKPVV